MDEINDVWVWSILLEILGLITKPFKIDLEKLDSETIFAMLYDFAVEKYGRDAEIVKYALTGEATDYWLDGDHKIFGLTDETEDLRYHCLLELRAYISERDLINVLEDYTNRRAFNTKERDSVKEVLYIIAIHTKQP